MTSELAEKIDVLKQLSLEELSAKFKCKPEEICVGDYIASRTEDEICPYKVILGFANFENSQVVSLGNLEIVYGKKLLDAGSVVKDINRNPIYLGLNLKNSKIKDLANLRKVYGTLSLNNLITSLANIEYLGSGLYLNQTKIKRIDSNIKIVGRLNIEDCALESLGDLEKVQTLYVNGKSLKSLGNVQSVSRIYLGSDCGVRVRSLFINNFYNISGRFERREKENSYY